MFKRMTDTEKWKNNAWFRKLPKDYKLFWLYLNDDCDNVGVWEIDIELANTLMGTKCDRENTFKHFGHRIYQFESKNGNTKLWIIGFCDFQYSGNRSDFNPESPANRPQESYVRLLKSHGLYDFAVEISKGINRVSIPYAKGINTPNDKDKDKETDIETKKALQLELEKNFEAFYKLYPRKRQKEEAYKAFSRLKPSIQLLSDIMVDVTERSKSHDWTKDRGEFIPYPATYLNKKRWTDEKYGQKSTRSRDNLPISEHKGW